MVAARRPWLPAALLVAALAAVLSVTIATILEADRRAADADVVAEQVAELETLALRLEQVRLRAGGQAGALQAATVAEGRDVIAELRRRMDRLRALRSRAELAALHAPLLSYASAATGHLGMLERGDVRGAEAVDVARLRPRQRALVTGIRAVEAREQARKRRAGATAMRVTIGALAGGFLALLALVLAGTRAHRRAQTAALRHSEADRDPLTGLVSRRRLETAIDEAIAGGAGLRLGVVDLDDFKAVNDHFGHATGDELLRIVGSRLSAVAPAGAVVARFGGDEFAILTPRPPGDDWLGTASARIARALQEPICLGARSVTVRASTGMAVLAPGESVGREELFHRADLAMYAAKRGGGNHVAPYEDGMREALVKRITLADELDAAIRGGQLRLHVQPIIDLRTERAVGMEALVRWQHPERGLVPPFEFIPIAEQTKLILPLGVWVVREACRIAAGWVAELGEAAPYVSVNLAAAQLSCPDIVETVRSALADAGLPPGQLLLELTESALIDDLEASAGRLEGLRRLGVRLAVDDFGTGYSSLDYLRRFAMDVLKIDRRFISGVHRGDAALVRAMIAMGRGLDLRTVAEGVEEHEQAAALRALGCGLAQGFLWSRPVPAAAGLATIERLSRVAPDVVATVRELPGTFAPRLARR